MKEIRIHGRGGQGSLVLAQFMALAALEDGKYGQAFPFLGGGGERRGKPIMAFCRLSDQAIRLRRLATYETRCHVDHRQHRLGQLGPVNVQVPMPCLVADGAAQEARLFVEQTR